MSPRDHENKAVNGGLPLTAGPLTQVDLVLIKPMNIWDPSKLTVIGRLPKMPGPREPVTHYTRAVQGCQ